MDDVQVRQLAGIVSGGAPLVLAAIGETFTERAGVVNLALDGSLMLSALAAFVVARGTESILLGAAAGVLVGMLVALLVAFSNIALRQSQVAVGFVLTLLCRDLAIFLGQPHRSEQGMPVPYLPIPGLRDIPIIGPILFNQDVFTYISLIVVVLAWFWIFRTMPGLALRTVGERPETAFARGTNVNLTRYLYTALGGGLVGLGGAAFTLAVSTTWLETAVSGNGWIALAIVIFGGWHPWRVMAGVYLVAALRAIVTGMQAQVSRQLLELLNALPWLFMIATLVLVSGPYMDRLLKILPPRLHPFVRTVFRARPPAALGTRFEREGRS
ncbi:MAG: ABC transporter permease [Anaerolineae bacterium]|nr:ABC transporter permease [Anaerolineae bacterium]